MPDLFVPIDTSNYSAYFGALSRKGVINSFVLEYADKNRTRIITEYKSFDDFKRGFEFSQSEIEALIKKGEETGVKFNDAQYKKSESDIHKVLKALVANNIWESNEYFRIINEKDELIEKALGIISDKGVYDSILGYR